MCVCYFLVKGKKMKEQPCVIGGVVIDVYIVIVQRETVRHMMLCGESDSENKNLRKMILNICTER